MYTKEIKKLKDDILNNRIDIVTIKETLLNQSNISGKSIPAGLFYDAIKHCFLDEFQLNVEFENIKSDLITEDMLKAININHLRFIFKKLDKNTVYLADINTIDINREINSITLRFEETDEGVEMYPVDSDFDNMNDWLENRADDKIKNSVFSDKQSLMEEKGIGLGEYTMFILVMYILESLVLINALSTAKVIKEGSKKYVGLTSSKKGKGKDKKKGPKKVKIVRSFYISENDFNDESTKREYHRTVESWNVRGHFRRYKNGKVVWIQPYTKGNGAKTPKIYEV